MKSETIITQDIKLFLKKITLGEYTFRRFTVGNAEEKNVTCCSFLVNTELQNANLANIRIL